MTIVTTTKAQQRHQQQLNDINNNRFATTSNPAQRQQFATTERNNDHDNSAITTTTTAQQQRQHSKNAQQRLLQCAKSSITAAITLHNSYRKNNNKPVDLHSKSSKNTWHLLICMYFENVYSTSVMQLLYWLYTLTPELDCAGYPDQEKKVWWSLNSENLPHPNFFSGSCYILNIFYYFLFSSSYPC